jgi:hypothetical protein
MFCTELHSSHHALAALVLSVHSHPLCFTVQPLDDVHPKWFLRDACAQFPLSARLHLAVLECSMTIAGDAVKNEQSGLLSSLPWA